LPSARAVLVTVWLLAEKAVRRLVMDLRSAYRLWLARFTRLRYYPATKFSGLCFAPLSRPRPTHVRHG
jgi:hypothetical protein